jgi:hypothetical protein
MKRIVIMLLIACSAITTASADPTAAAPQKKPENVIRIMNTLIDRFGAKERQIYSVNRNPNTGTIESSLRAVTFYCDAPGTYIPQVIDCFTKDEPLSYQFMHLTNPNEQKVIVDVLTNNGQNNTQVHVRTLKEEELWFMCIKNPENPQLRDIYAISWKYVDNRKVASGSVYMITSLRPDLYQKNMSSAGLLSDNRNTFTIDGRVGYDLKDSLYVVYMADNAEELSNVKDSDFVATMPVVNKRFSFSVELDKPKVGRIRTVMPDGSLCELWTNLDFVPGETYRITTHNGYYDEDRDYEQRVGRYSGKSLLNDLQRRGIDDQTAVVTEKVPEEFVVVEEGGGVNVGPKIRLPQSSNEMDKWRNNLPLEQLIEIEQKVKVLQSSIKMVEGSYEVIGQVMSQGPAFNARLGFYVDRQCDEILKRNKELDKVFTDVVKTIKALNPPQSLLDEMYSEGFKEVLDVFTKQNNSFNEIFNVRGSLSKKARKTQKYINDLTEKYMNQMNKHVIGSK